MTPFVKRLALAIGLGLFTLVTAAPQPAAAHFSEGSRPRTILVDTEGGDGLTVYVRVPAPLLFADRVAQSVEQRTRLDGPFLDVRRVGSTLDYRLDGAAIAADADGFRERLASALLFEQNGRRLSGAAGAFALHPAPPETPFDTPEEARAALAADHGDARLPFGNAVVDYVLTLDAPVPEATLGIRSGFPPLMLPAGVSIDNHIRDLRFSDALSLSVPGQLEAWAWLDGSAWTAAFAFVEQGVIHILEGLDHVLLVLCLALGAGRSWRLLALTGAFTVGHGVTLVAAFLRQVPEAPWFIPAVETAIAATVLYAAVSALLARREAIWVMGVVGLLHGLGFSFVLSQILGPSSPDLVAALAAFTVGIELGQIAIIVASLALIALLTALSARLSIGAQRAALAAIALLSAVWVVERGLSLA